MPTLLQIQASIYGDEGNSSALTRTFVTRWKSHNPRGVVVVRDFCSNPIPHLERRHVAAWAAPADDRDEPQRAAVALSDALIDEIRSANEIVFGLPMYNFGVPSQVKAYFDHIARVGVTFRYTDTGPIGLLTDKPVYVLAARGGFYERGEGDFQTPYVRGFLAFLGLKDVRFVYAEGLNIDENIKRSALASAEAQIAALFR